jgi:HSP20 family protein
LPFPVDAERVSALYQKGILQITLPRQEQDKPKKISVKAA